MRKPGVSALTSLSIDVVTMFHLQLAASTDKRRVYGVLEKYRPNVLFSVGFSNLPNLILSFVWTNTMKELRDVRRGFRMKKCSNR